MADCFIVRCSGSPAKVVPPLVLFEGTDKGYSLADGFTGFSAYYTDTSAGGIAYVTQNVDATTESKYGYLITKAWSINGSDANYTDSAVISSNEAIDLTDFNTICVDFYGYSDYSTTSMSAANDMATYFRIDHPETLPQSKIAYDWMGWDNMFMNYKKYGKYYFDISKISGKHYLSFGVFHGSYQVGFTNGIKIYKITLV